MYIADARHHKLKCIQRKCGDCGCDAIVSFFKPLAQVMPVSHRSSVTHIVVKLAEELEKLAGHLFVAFWQQQQFSLMLKNVKKS